MRLKCFKGQYLQYRSQQCVRFKIVITSHVKDNGNNEDHDDDQDDDENNNKQ